jgi:hypothetical protein
MTRFKPSHETHVAAELVAALDLPPGRAAMIAAELCGLGRRWARITARLAGGQDEWGDYPRAGQLKARAEKQRDRIKEACRELLTGFGPRAHVAQCTSGGMYLKFHTVRGRGANKREESTVLT